MIEGRRTRLKHFYPCKNCKLGFYNAVQRYFVFWTVAYNILPCTARQRVNRYEPLLCASFFFNAEYIVALFDNFVDFPRSSRAYLLIIICQASQYTNILVRNFDINIKFLLLLWLLSLLLLFLCFGT